MKNKDKRDPVIDSFLQAGPLRSGSGQGLDGRDKDEAYMEVTVGSSIFFLT